MNLKEAKKTYRVVIEYTNLRDRIYGAFYLLFHGWAGSNGDIKFHSKALSSKGDGK